MKTERTDSRTNWPALLAIATVILLPLQGRLVKALPLELYFEFPPRTHYIAHAGFSWPVFGFMALLILGATMPFVVKVLIANMRRGTAPDTGLRQESGSPGRFALPKPESAQKRWDEASRRAVFSENDAALPPDTPAWRAVETSMPSSAVRRFPRWGWLGVGFGIAAWIMAWSRFEWFAPLQTFTFSPLWFAYIVVVNALAYRRAGRCMLTHETKYFLSLFPLSAGFWWLFEYLNRFVQNWYYVGIDALTPWQYLLYATLPFSTVLPAVMGTLRLLETHPRLTAGLDDFLAVPWIRTRGAAVGIFAVSAAGLVFIGVWPDGLFPLLWLAPLSLLIALQILAGRPPDLLDGPGRGDWRRVALMALSALICGLFWEMWNYFSQAMWVYAVPYVSRFHIFEMPALGYAGYLPFGLECAVIADLLRGRRPIENQP